MVPDRYVWFVWSGAMLLSWLGLYAAFPAYRRPMLWMSLFTLPFGLSEPLFVNNYWNPPSLFNLAGRIHFDIESFVHCFAIGGVGTVLYNAVTARPIQIPVKTLQQARHRELYNLAMACPALVLVATIWLWNQMMLASVIGMLTGALARLVYQPTLRTKTLAGGPLFLAYFVLFLFLLEWMAPGYIQRVWRPRTLARPMLGMPLSELLFAFAFGMFWSGLYEQWRWTFAGPSQETSLGIQLPSRRGERRSG